MKYEKALDDLKRQVRDGETLLMWCKASLRPLDAKKASFSIPVAAVTSVDQSRQTVQTYTVITVQGGVQHRFLVLPANLLAKLDELRFAPKGSTQGQAAAGDVDGLDRLVQLHAAGHLSDAEFTAAKAKLLGL